MIPQQWRTSTNHTSLQRYLCRAERPTLWMPTRPSHLVLPPTITTWSPKYTSCQSNWRGRPYYSGTPEGSRQTTSTFILWPSTWKWRGRWGSPSGYERSPKSQCNSYWIPPWRYRWWRGGKYTKRYRSDTQQPPSVPR